MSFQELHKKLNEIGDAATGRFDQLQSRLEMIEAQADRARLLGGDNKPSYKTFYSENGVEHYAVPSEAKLSSIPGLNKANKPDVSLERWLQAVAAGDRCKDANALAFAKQQKAMTTASTGVLIPVEYQSEWFDRIRAQMVLNKAGLTTVPMNQKSVTWSAVTADPSVTWHAEGGSISAANPTFAARTLTANTIVIRSQGSVELAQDCPDFGAQLTRVLTGAIAADIDRAGLHGAGSDEPQGIYGASGITTTSSVGTPADFTDLTGAIKTLMDNNVPLDIASKYAIMNPRTWLTYENLVTGISSDKTPLARPPSLANMEFLATSNVSKTLGSPAVGSAIFLGNFADLVMGTRLDASMEIVKADAYVGNLVLDFVAFARVDFVLARPASFVVLDGVTA